MLRPIASGRTPRAGELDYVHLADLPPYAGAQGERQDLWDSTSDFKRELLPDELERSKAKAKVSFVLPADMRARIPKAETYTWSPQEKK
jgi:hypothetical protein